MSDSTVNLVSEFEGETSHASIMGTSTGSYLPILGRNHLGSEIIPLSDDSDS